MKPSSIYVAANKLPRSTEKDERWHVTLESFEHDKLPDQPTAIY